MLCARCSLLVARCSLLVARCSLLVARCSLLVARCSLLIPRSRVVVIVMLRQSLILELEMQDFLERSPRCCSPVGLRPTSWPSCQVEYSFICSIRRRRPLLLYSLAQGCGCTEKGGCGVGRYMLVRLLLLLVRVSLLLLTGWCACQTTP